MVQEGSDGNTSDGTPFALTEHVGLVATFHVLWLKDGGEAKRGVWDEVGAVDRLRGLGMVGVLACGGSENLVVLACDPETMGAGSEGRTAHRGTGLSPQKAH